MAREALEIDSASTLALNVVAFARFLSVSYRTAGDPNVAWQEGLTAATRAIELDGSDSHGYLRKGLLLTVAPEQNQFGEALANLRTAHELNPNDANVLTVLGWCEALLGQPEQGIQYLHSSLRLAPRNPLRYATRANLATAYSLARDYAQAVDYALLAANEVPSFSLPHTILAVAYVGLGDIDKAKASLNRALALAPEYVQVRLDGIVGYPNPKDRQQYITFLRIAAGLEDPSAADALR